jgi:hypothetical protein
MGEGAVCAFSAAAINSVPARIPDCIMRLVTFMGQMGESVHWSQGMAPVALETLSAIRNDYHAGEVHSFARPHGAPQQQGQRRGQQRCACMVFTG